MSDGSFGLHVSPGAKHRFRPVEPDRLDAQSHLALARIADIEILDAQLLGATVFVKANHSAHRVILCKTARLRAANRGTVRCRHDQRPSG